MGKGPNNPATAKSPANGFHFLPNPSVIMYIVPPCKCPSESCPRYITESVQVKNLVAIPTMALIHIQKTAPGPPTAIATATPLMFPIPTVAASALAKASK